MAQVDVSAIIVNHQAREPAVRLARALFVFPLLCFAAQLLPAAEGPAPRAIVLAWDGAASIHVKELLAEGKLPHLARLIAGGAFAPAVVSVSPPKTAPGFASLWTGAPPRINGISGNAVPATPRNSFTILDSVSGFSSTALQAEPLWMAAARSGKRVVVLQATQGYPFEPYIRGRRFGAPQPDRLFLFEGYAGLSGSDGVVTATEAPPVRAAGWVNLPPSARPPLEFSFAIAGARLFGLLIDDPRDDSDGYDTLLIAGSRDGASPAAELKAREPDGTLAHWSGAVELPGASGLAVRLRLFALRADGGDFLLYFTRPARDLGSRPDLAKALRRAAGPFAGDGAGNRYARGELGPTLVRGGDGTAERRYLETLRLTVERTRAAAEWALESLPWDLLLLYVPLPDQAEHLWRGYIAAAPQRTLKLRGFLEETYRICDQLLGDLLRLRPPGSLIALVSDHGMEAVTKKVVVNEALRRAGLLVLDHRGRVDLARTRALYPTGNSGYILINGVDRKAGIVQPGERAEVVERVRNALRALTENGEPVVTGVIDEELEGERLGIGRESGGDLYLELKPGYDFSPRLQAKAPVAARAPAGMHSFGPDRESMRTIMVFNGPGVAAGKIVTQARTIDFAPTLAHLLGIEPPRQATGRILSEALLDP